MRHLVVAALVLAACSKSKAPETPPAEPAPVVPVVKAEPAPAAPAPAPDAAPYRMQKPNADPCNIFGFADLSRVGLPLQVEVPQTDLTDISQKDSPGVELRGSDDIETRLYWLKISKATAKDDFKKVKAEIDGRTKKYKATITWKTAEETPDGYHLVYTELGAAKGATLGYSVVYVRTIAGTKYRCANDAVVEASTACAIRSCDSLKAL